MRLKFSLPSTCQPMHIGGARSSSQEKDVPCSWCQLLTNLVSSVLHLLIWVLLSNSQEATAQASGGLCTVAITFLLQVHLHLNPFPSSVLTFLHCKPDLASSLHFSAAHCHPEVAIQSPGHDLQSPRSSDISPLSRLISPHFSQHTPSFSCAGHVLVAGMYQNGFHRLHSFSCAVYLG